MNPYLQIAGLKSAFDPQSPAANDADMGAPDSPSTAKASARFAILTPMLSPLPRMHCRLCRRGGAACTCPFSHVQNAKAEGFPARFDHPLPLQGSPALAVVSRKTALSSPPVGSTSETRLEPYMFLGVNELRPRSSVWIRQLNRRPQSPFLRDVTRAMAHSCPTSSGKVPGNLGVACPCD
jgi:hypothetical protein